MRDYNLDPPEDPVFQECPRCRSDYYSTIFFDIDDNIIGCDCCVYTKDAYEYWEEQNEIAKQVHDDMLYDEWREQQCGLR